jgi:hypothetical protein
MHLMRHWAACIAVEANAPAARAAGRRTDHFRSIAHLLERFGGFETAGELNRAAAAYFPVADVVDGEGRHGAGLRSTRAVTG